MEGWRKENCVIYVCSTIGVLGMFYMSHDMRSLWMLLLLLFAGFKTTPKQGA